MLKQLVAKTARRVLKQAGVEVRKIETETVTPLTSLEHPGLAIYHRDDVAFEVPIEKCSSLMHFSYSPAGWHPFTQMLKEYESNPQLRYETSVLHKFYQSYQPKNVLDAFLGHLPQAEAFAASPLATLHMPEYHPVFPWDPEQRVRQPGIRPGGLGTAHGDQNYGPVSDTKGELEFRRVTETYESIKQRGYHPGVGKDGDIRGFFLKTNDDYRFIIRQGLHRTPALSVLGYSKIRVKFFNPLPRAIFLSDLDNWPQVSCGLMSPEVAEHIFVQFFRDDGTYKAERLGLLKQGAKASVVEQILYERAA